MPRLNNYEQNQDIGMLSASMSATVALWLYSKDYLAFTETIVVREGTMGRSAKASHIALLWPKSSHIALLEGKMGRFRPILPFWKGNMGRPSHIALLEGQYGTASRTRKEGGGEAILVSGRAVWPHFGGGGRCSE